MIRLFKWSGYQGKHREGIEYKEYLTAVFPIPLFFKRAGVWLFSHHLIKLGDRKGLQTRKNLVKINFKKDNSGMFTEMKGVGSLLEPWK